MKNLIQKAKTEHELTHAQIVDILESSEFDEELFLAADCVREKFVGSEVHLRALIEFSNICKCSCKYCGLRKDNSQIDRYRLTENEILESAKNAIQQGYKTIVMQSGEDSFFKAEALAKVIREIKKSNVAVTLSIGERSFEDYEILKNAGADRYLIRIETTDQELYSKMHPNMSFENRLRCLRDLKTLNFEVGTGCLVGLPGQTLASLANDILFFKEIDADMIGIGPFIPCPNTPLEAQACGGFNLALKVMALTRLLLPDINIPATTAMETLNPNGRIIALQSGANVVMPNVTEEDYKDKYEIYPGKSSVSKDPIFYRNSLAKKLESIGRSVSTEYGFHKRIH